MRGSHRFALGGLGAILVLTAGMWALALWPAPERIPAWLLRAKVACFGSTPSGLPDASGWIVLTLQPALMLAILFAGWKNELEEALRYLLRLASGRAAVSFSAAFLIAGLGAAGFRIASAGASPAEVATAPPANFDYPRLDREAPSLDLVDQHGARFSLEQLSGRPVILTFAYAHCATVCPLIVRNAIRARREHRGAKPALVVVTLDPERDTPERLPAIARSWGLEDGEYLLSGGTAEVLAALEAWGVPRNRDPRTGEITHPVLTFLIDREGRIAYALTGAAFDPAELLEKL
ncbi:MAG: hypothetical protein KatS3mg081_2414 [Gemmatimonadales bacterium]|nr:MAG: hypothetical protein KatS3mg081_2414 [Gemmatimonadales bacterium]